MWDDQVDVVCIGAGIAVWATAIAAVDAGLDVVVAHPGVHAGASSGAAGSSPSWFARAFTDAATAHYFAALTADLGTPVWTPRGLPMTTRTAENIPPVGNRSAIEPFIGARLRQWAADCVASPQGYVSTRIVDHLAALRTADGEAIGVTALGAVDLDGGASLESAVGDWLLSRARDRGIVGRESSRLTRIVFDEGEITGVVLATPEGPLALRTRVGVAVAPEHPPGAGAPESTMGVTGTMQVCLVGHTASRFGRVELLAADPLPAISRTGCVALDRPSPDSGRESRPARSTSRR